MTVYFAAPEGNDTWPGNENQPWRSIQKAANVMKAGDITLFKNGVYHESPRIGCRGTASAPVIFEAYPGHTPIIDGRAGVDGLNEGLPGGAFPAGDKLKNPKTGARAKMKNLIMFDGARFVEFRGFKQIRSMGRGICTLNSENILVENCWFGHNRQTNILVEGGSKNVTFKGCTSTGSGSYYPERRRPSSTTDWAASIAVKGHNIRFIECDIFENWGEAAIAQPNRAELDGVSFERCRWWDNMKACAFHAVKNFQFINNMIFVTEQERRTGKFTGGDLIGVSAKSTESKHLGAIETVNGLIQGNVAVGCSTGFSVHGAQAKEILRNVEVSHNTAVNCGKGFDLRVVNKRDCRFFNNVTYGCDLPVDDRSNGNRVGDGNWTFSHNLYNKPVPAAYRGPGDIIGNSLLVNPDVQVAPETFNPANYALRDKSPAIDAAKANIGALPDMYGTERDMNDKADMGFLEYTGDAPPTDPPVDPPVDPPDDDIPPQVETPTVIYDGNAVVVTWPHIENVIEYNVQEYPPSGGVNVHQVQEAYYERQAPESGVWHFRVRATYNRVDYSQRSEAGSVEVTDVAPPPPPPVTEIEIDIEVGAVTWECIFMEDSVTAIRRE